MSNQKKLHNPSAFSLIEMMIVVGMMSVSSLATMTLVSYQTASQRGIRVRTEMRDFAREIQHKLSYRGICTANFGAVVPGPSHGTNFLKPWSSGITAATNQGAVTIGRSLFTTNSSTAYGIVTYNPALLRNILNPDDDFGKKGMATGGKVYLSTNDTYSTTGSKNTEILAEQNAIVGITADYPTFLASINDRWGWLFKFDDPLRNNSFKIMDGDLYFPNPADFSKIHLRLTFEAMGQVTGPKQSIIEIPILISGYFERTGTNFSDGTYIAVGTPPATNRANYSIETCRALPPAGYFAAGGSSSSDGGGGGGGGGDGITLDNLSSVTNCPPNRPLLGYEESGGNLVAKCAPAPDPLACDNPNDFTQGKFPITDTRGTTDDSDDTKACSSSSTVFPSCNTGTPDYKKAQVVSPARVSGTYETNYDCVADGLSCNEGTRIGTDLSDPSTPRARCSCPTGRTNFISPNGTQYCVENTQCGLCNMDLVGVRDDRSAVCNKKEETLIRQAPGGPSPWGYDATSWTLACPISHPIARLAAQKHDHVGGTTNTTYTDTYLGCEGRSLVIPSGSIPTSSTKRLQLSFNPVGHYNYLAWGSYDMTNYGGSVFSMATGNVVDNIASQVFKYNGDYHLVGFGQYVSGTTVSSYGIFRRPIRRGVQDINNDFTIDRCPLHQYGGGPYTTENGPGGGNTYASITTAPETAATNAWGSNSSWEVKCPVRYYVTAFSSIRTSISTAGNTAGGRYAPQITCKFYTHTP